MSTVTLSKPHCAITSAENPEGIASQAFTTALPEAQIFLTLFAIGRVSLLSFGGPSNSLNGPERLTHSPLYTHLAHADVARGIHYRRPGIVRQGHAVFGALGAHPGFRLARDQHGSDVDQRALRQFLAATACNQHLAFGDDRSGKIQYDRPLPLAWNADAIGRRRHPPLDPAIGGHQHRARGVDEVD